jgi:hypothetical protein
MDPPNDIRNLLMHVGRHYIKVSRFCKRQKACSAPVNLGGIRECSEPMKLQSIVLLIFFVFSLNARASSVVRGQYIAFADRSDFEAYLKLSFADSFDKLVRHADPKYLRAETVLQRVWRGYKKLYPAETNGLPVPSLAILKSPFLDAYVTEDPKNHLLPDAFFMFERIADMTELELAGIMAHELTHLLMPKFKEQFYQISGKDEPLGFLQANDLQVEKTVNELKAITSVVGPFTVPELNGLPAPIVYDGQLFNIISFMAKKWGNPANASCGVIQQAMPLWRLNLALKFVSMVDETVKMTEIEKSVMNDQTQLFTSHFRSCLGNQEGQLLPILSQLLGKAESALVNYKRISEIFDRESNVVDGFFAVSSSESLKLADFQKNHDLARLRNYSAEEIADDNSVRILRAIGLPGPSIEDFFFALMDDAQPGASTTCRAILDSGKIPPYGILTDTHHAGCYRIYHVRQLSQWLDRVNDR